MAWSKAEMASDKLAMPNVCPNCMRPAAHPWTARYSVGNDAYYCTTFYCDPCDAMHWRNRTTSRLMLWGAPVGLIAGLAVAVALVLQGALFIATVIGVAVGLVLAIWLLRRRPSPEGALTRGFAAFYCGTATVGGGMRSRYVHYFRALRDEWLELLIDLNAADTDPDEYKRRRGKARPVV